MRKYINNVPDFKVDGEWVECFSPENNVVCRTNLGRYWTDMQARCKINGSKQAKNPSYIGCINLFSDFQDFANWATTQVGFDLGYHLDKDLLSKEGKVYSKDTCLFLPSALNLSISSRKRLGKVEPVGVYLHKASGKYLARVQRNYLYGDTISKLFENTEEAREWYVKEKKMYLLKLLNLFEEKMENKAVEAFTFYVNGGNFD